MKGQITIFIILGVLVVIFVALFVVVSNISTFEPEQKKAVSAEIDLSQIQNYMTNCLQKESDDAVFALGERGGYFFPDGNPLTGEQAASTTTFFRGKKLPILTVAPTMQEIEQKIAAQVHAQFDRCLNLSSFEMKGITFTIPKTEDVSTKVSINKNDVTITMHYPLAFEKAGAKNVASDINAKVPIRLGMMLNNTNTLITKLQSASSYDVSADCDLYDPDRMVNVYVESSQDNIPVVQFIDYTSYSSRYVQSFIFQFAIQGNIQGKCER